MCSSAPQTLFYIYIPTIFLIVVLGFFVLLGNIKKNENRLFFLFSLTVSLWLLFNMLNFMSTDEEFVLLFDRASIVGILTLPIFLSFSYFFGEENSRKKLSLAKIFFIFFLPLIFLLLSGTKYNIRGLTPSPDCETIPGILYWLMAFLLVGYFIWIFFVLYKKYKIGENKIKNQIKIIFFGILFLLIWVLITNVISQIVKVESLSLLGPIGVLFFIASVSYNIVKHQFLNIKLIAAQALTYSIWVLIGSQFFFIKSTINFVLTGITLALSIIFGMMLVKSIKEEVRRKEELQTMTEKLAVANDELRKLDNAKSEFISIASHQLRTPLTSVKGYISLLLEGNYGKIDGVILDPINKIYASNERLIQLVEELLNVSRIESGRMEFTFEKSSIEKIIQALHDTFSVIAKANGLYLHLNLPSEPLPEAEIDAGKTREVISNLMDNALKYTKRGGVTVKAELVKDMKWNVKHAGGQDENLSGDVIRITISDTGMGVPDTELPYLFSKFSRGKDTSRLRVSGTGLGLYVGKNIIESQHGKIWVESEGSGKGSRFIVDLPLVQPKA